MSAMAMVTVVGAGEVGVDRVMGMATLIMAITSISALF